MLGNSSRKNQAHGKVLLMARSQRPPAQQRLPAPSEFMRGRRPELFSDSTERSELVLEPSRLEYHLDSMTARSEEKQFEHYCRQLCAREICPSLRVPVPA